MLVAAHLVRAIAAPKWPPSAVVDLVSTTVEYWSVSAVKSGHPSRLQSDHLGGLGADSEAGCGGRAEGAHRGAAGDLSDDGVEGGAVRVLRGMSGRRRSRPSSAFEPRVRALLAATPDMPATVIAERVEWSGSIAWFRENVLRPEHRPVDPADRFS
jgi:hypothetical protein